MPEVTTQAAAISETRFAARDQGTSAAYNVMKRYCDEQGLVIMPQHLRFLAGIAVCTAEPLSYCAGRDAGMGEGSAAEREAIIRLATEHGACYYAEPRPCGHKADCSVVTRDRVPFADLIRKERGNG